MIEDGAVTITVGELDFLRKAEEYYKDLYDKKSKNLVKSFEDRERILKENEEVLKEKAEKYLVATLNRGCGGYSYVWKKGTELFRGLEQDRYAYYKNEVDKYLLVASMREIRKRKREVS